VRVLEVKMKTTRRDEYLQLKEAEEHEMQLKEGEG
jgi:hypothetical protein